MYYTTRECTVSPFPEANKPPHEVAFVIAPEPNPDFRSFLGHAWEDSELKRFSLRLDRNLIFVDISRHELASVPDPDVFSKHLQVCGSYALKKCIASDEAAEAGRREERRRKDDEIKAFNERFGKKP